MASRSKYYTRQSGQSVIIAIAVLFILAFLAAIFVAVLARNLASTNRSSETITADFYARAGVQYADQMLTTSPQGADWRPPLQYRIPAANQPPADEGDAYNAYIAAHPTIQTVPTDDPDAFWLDQGFTRYSMPGGRYLLRISYGGQQGSIFDNPNPATSKYIRIESVGRTGVVVANDPTTFTPQPIRLHAELVAFKPIGLVDYSRFITDKYNRPDTANLGTPSTFDQSVQNSIVTPGVYDFSSNGSAYAVSQYPLVTVYGDPYASTGGSNLNVGFGGGLRCNTNLRLYGFNAAFLNGSAGDDWEIAGNLTFDGFNASSVGAPSATNPTVLTVNGTDTTGAAAAGKATPSNITDTSFGGQYNTIGGLIRDAGSQSDLNGFARSIKRLNPPDLDTVNASTGLSRYQGLTQTGTPLITTPSASPAGPYSVESDTSPATVYIDNASDVQQESSNVQSGGYTLRDDWLNRSSVNWEGPFYNPPGATIVFGPMTVQVGSGTQPYWGFTVTRTDQPVGLPSGSPVTWQWKDASGKTVVQSTPAPTIEFAYGNMPAGYVFDANNPVYFLGADNIRNGSLYRSGGKYDNDIVIYAQGNVRVRGVVSPTSKTDPVSGDYYEPSQGDPPPHHVTIVTGQIAYIEGSLLKGGAGYAPGSTPGAGYASNSSIAVLAESYVCLNTTQFLAGASLRSDLAAEATDPAAQTIDFDTNTLTEAFDIPANSYASNVNVAPPSLYLSASAGGDSGASYGQITLNLVPFDGTAYATPAVYDGATMYSGASNLTASLQGASGTYNRSVLATAPTGSVLPGLFNAPATGFTHLEFTITKSPESAATYQLQRAAVLPSDVRIEAVLYAQNNSFFVIPGPWFNDDATDAIDKYVNAGDTRPHPDQNATQTGFTDEHFPFYGQPIDMQITVDGSVVENMPANIADQTAWMLKWGWIPKYQGAPVQTGAQVAAHESLFKILGATTAPLNGIPPVIQPSLPGVGLDIAYDTAAGSAASGGNYDRLDQFGRPLPYTPNLPVSPDLLYSGATPGNSLVQ